MCSETIHLFVFHIICHFIIHGLLPLCTFENTAQDNPIWSDCISLQWAYVNICCWKTKQHWIRPFRFPHKWIAPHRMPVCSHPIKWQSRRWMCCQKGGKRSTSILQLTIESLKQNANSLSCFRCDSGKHLGNSTMCPASNEICKLCGKNGLYGHKHEVEEIVIPELNVLFSKIAAPVENSVN